MELKELMKTKPEDLADVQLKALKAHVIGVLREVIKAVESENYKELRFPTGDSPAGDGYGSDNTYIDFSYDQTESKDIEQIFRILDRLKSSTKST